MLWGYTLPPLRHIYLLVRQRDSSRSWLHELVMAQPIENRACCFAYVLLVVQAALVALRLVMSHNFFNLYWH